MKADLYTKCVLTVIAATLLWMCVDSITKPVSAQGPVRVVIDGANPAMVPVSVRLIGGTRYNVLPVDADNPLAVTAVGR